MKRYAPTINSTIAISAPSSSVPTRCDILHPFAGSFCRKKPISDARSVFRYPRSMTAAVRSSVLVVALVLTLVSSSSVVGQQPTPAAPASTPPAAEPLPPLPPYAHVAQTIQLGAKALNYTATVGTLPTYGSEGKKTGEVVFTAYTMDGAAR